MAEIPNVPDATVANPAPALLKRVTWGAIFAGSIIALGVTALLGMLGLAIGFRAIDPNQADAFGGVDIGTAIWWAVTSIIATGLGGYVAAHFAGLPDRIAAIGHGAAVWGVVTIVTLWFAVSAVGTLLNTATGAVGTVARTAANVVGAAGGAIISDELGAQLSPALQRAREQIRQEAAQIAREAGITEQDVSAVGRAIGNTAQQILRRPGDAGEEINSLIDRLFTGSDAIISPEERDRLATALASRFGLTPEEAQRVAQRWQNQAQAAREQVGQTTSDIRQTAGRIGESALDALSTAAWYAFFASLLSLIAAMAAAIFGAPRHVYVSERE